MVDSCVMILSSKQRDAATIVSLIFFFMDNPELSMKKKKQIKSRKRNDKMKGNKGMMACVYVYLYELDSVRKSDQQVIKGQQALFDEIVCNGNCVVLSLNQLTDSRAILSMLRTKQQMNTLLQLFQKGHLNMHVLGIAVHLLITFRNQ